MSHHENYLKDLKKKNIASEKLQRDHREDNFLEQITELISYWRQLTQLGVADKNVIVLKL